MEKSGRKQWTASWGPGEGDLGRGEEGRGGDGTEHKQKEGKALLSVLRKANFSL